MGPHLFNKIKVCSIYAFFYCLLNDIYLFCSTGVAITKIWNKCVKIDCFHWKKPNARVFKRLQYRYDVIAEFFEVHILRSLPIRLIFITIFPLPFFHFSWKNWPILALRGITHVALWSRFISYIFWNEILHTK